MVEDIAEVCTQHLRNIAGYKQLWRVEKHERYSVHRGGIGGGEVVVEEVVGEREKGGTR